jgi:hypothetical protein
MASVAKPGPSFADCGMATSDRFFCRHTGANRGVRVN